MVTVNVNEVMPALPSTALTSSIANVGAASSFVIVPVPASSAIVAPTGVDRPAVRFSSASYVVSP